MLSKNPAEPQASKSGDAKAGTARTSTPPLNPWDKIETASTGNGSTNDPAGNDNQPPGVADLELLA